MFKYSGAAREVDNAKCPSAVISSCKAFEIQDAPIGHHPWCWSICLIEFEQRS
jgi:hypothetical protein